MSEVSEVPSPAEPSPSLIVTVYGADHPGIVHAVTATLAERGANITDLATRLVGGEEGTAVYAMMMEVALPAGTSEADVRAPLEAVAREQGLRRRSGRLSGTCWSAGWPLPVPVRPVLRYPHPSLKQVAPAVDPDAAPTWPSWRRTWSTRCARTSIASGWRKPNWA